MHVRFFILAVVISSLFGYLEWGRGNHSFLFQGEVHFFVKLFTDPKSVMHVFTILPVLGQLVLIFTLFQKHPNFWLVAVGITGLAVLLLFMFFIGISIGSWKIALSIVPFIIFSSITLLFKSKLFV